MLWKFKLKLMAWHVVASASIAVLVAILVFKVWYPFPYAPMMGVGSIFGIALVVDVTCGPLMTAILANPKKSTRERWIDFGLVGAIQLAALAYAVHALYIVRPVAQVFEVDRFVVVSANEVLTDQLDQSPLSIAELPRFTRLLLGTRNRLKSEDIFQAAQMSIAGTSPAMRPSWWVDYVSHPG